MTNLNAFKIIVLSFKLRLSESANSTSHKVLLLNDHWGTTTKDKN